MRLALALLLVSTAYGQTFRHLAATDDGSRLYFSADLPASGIFVFDGQGTRLFAHEDNGSLEWPSVSGDGRVVGFSAMAPGNSQARVAFANGSVFWNYSGQVSLSRNGRFALFMAGGPEPKATVVDLAGGPGYTTVLPAGTTGRSIASDGAIAVSAPNAILVVRPSGIDTFDSPDTPSAAAIDDQATAVAYIAGGNLMLLDLATGTSTPLGIGASPQFTAGGQDLLYLAPDANGTQQAWLARKDNLGTRQLTFDASGIAEAAISGDGNTAFAIAGGIHVLRVDIPSGASHDITLPMLNIPIEPPRVVSFKLTAGQLCYNVANAKTVTIQPAFGSVPPPTACLTVPAAKATYTLIAANDLGVATASAAGDEGPPRITSFKNDPSFSPISGGAVTLSWTTENAEVVTMTGLGAPSGRLPANGSTVVRPDTNTSYTLFAYSANGQVVNTVLYVFVR